MDNRDILSDAAGRPLFAVGQVLEGISSETLHAMPESRSNSIAWLAWHAARQMDVQVSALKGEDQEWQTGDWGTKLAIGRGPDSFGFGDTAADVAMLKVQDPELLRQYFEAATRKLTTYVQAQTDEQLGEVIDESYDPPVTRGARLVSIIDDAAVHVGQAAYVRGLLEDWSIGY